MIRDYRKKLISIKKTKTATYDKGKIRTLLWNEESDKKTSSKKKHRITASVSTFPVQ